MNRYPSQTSSSARNRKTLPVKQRPNEAGITRLSTLMILLVVLGLAGILAVNRQAVFDWLKLHDYKPPAQVSQLADQDTMTPKGRKIFFVNHPLLSAKQSFAAYCPSSSREQTIVLGCYHSNQAGVYVLDVTDSRLEGIEQVTAAHEMLHAAYDRLNGQQKSSVNKMLEDYYKNGLTDDRIRETIDAYKQTEPSDLVNEMHSIFGTEIVSLPAGLENYYKQYFGSRTQVAGFAAKYQSEFSSRQAQVSQMDQQLSAWKKQIESSQASLKDQQSQIETQRNSLLALRSRGDVNAYNAGVPTYNNLVDKYNSSVRELQSVVSQFNDLVAKRNAIALEEDQLVNELKANVAPIQQ
jgi:uncharacterized protein YaaR (DUF327 family)